MSGAHHCDGQARESERHRFKHRSSTSTAWTRAAFAAIALVLSFVAPVAAGPLEDANAAYDRGDYAAALRLWGPLANQGDARAQFNLGRMYYEGRGVPQNHAEAVKWYRLVADQGDARAQGDLAAMYVNGWGVPQNHAEAVKWYRLAADQGDASAQTILGIMYHFGQGVPQDYAEAQKWFRLAADQGDANAQGSLGGMYRRSEDYVRAHMWYNLGSGLIDHSQKMTAAAMQMADMKVWAHRS